MNLFPPFMKRDTPHAKNMRMFVMTDDGLKGRLPPLQPGNPTTKALDNRPNFEVDEDRNFREALGAVGFASGTLISCSGMAALWIAEKIFGAYPVLMNNVHHKGSFLAITGGIVAFTSLCTLLLNMRKQTMKVADSK